MASGALAELVQHTRLGQRVLGAQQAVAQHPQAAGVEAVEARTAAIVSVVEPFVAIVNESCAGVNFATAITLMGSWHSTGKSRSPRASTPIARLRPNASGRLRFEGRLEATNSRSGWSAYGARWYSEAHGGDGRHRAAPRPAGLHAAAPARECAGDRVAAGGPALVRLGQVAVWPSSRAATVPDLAVVGTGDRPHRRPDRLMFGYWWRRWSSCCCSRFSASFRVEL